MSFHLYMRGLSSSSISMLHFSKKLILSDSNSLVQEPEMQVITATLAQHNNTFILRQIRFQWCSMYLCIGSFWRYWVKNQRDETFNVTLMTHTHTQKDYIQYCMRPFDYGIFCAHTKCSLLCHVTNLLSGAPQLRVCFGWPIWSRSVQLSQVVYLRIDVSVKSTIRRHSTNCSTTFWNNRRQSKCGGNEHIENRSLNSRELSTPFTQIQLLRCCETIGWIWVQRRVDTLLSDGACWNGSCLSSCRKRNSTCL